MLWTMLHQTVRTRTLLCEKGFGYVFLFAGGSAKGIRRTVNENEQKQRQGVTAKAIPCLLPVHTTTVCLWRTAIFVYQPIEKVGILIDFFSSAIL